MQEVLNVCFRSIFSLFPLNSMLKVSKGLSINGKKKSNVQNKCQIAKWPSQLKKPYLLNSIKDARI